MLANPTNPTSRPQLRRGLLVGSAVVVFLLAGGLMAWFLGRALGWHTVLLSAGLAAIPLLIVVPLFLWLDRLEAEPTRYLLFAFLWGAVCATLGALVLNSGFLAVLVSTGLTDFDTAEVYAAVVSAPLVEESLKAAAILIILLVRRREFDGVIDGVVYAGMVGSGFAFVENILYLGQAMTAGEDVVLVVFIMRCLMGPFAHPLFTAATGIGIGLGVANARSVWGRWGYGLGGFAVAVCLHGIWNLSAMMDAFQPTYFAFQVPLFIAFLVMFVLLRRRERRHVALYLSQYADAGWLTHSEVAMLAGLTHRRAARRWAASHRGAAGKAAMVAFQDTGSALALLRSRMARGAAEAGAQQHESYLLTQLTAQRSAFLGR